MELSNEEKIKKIEAHFREIMLALGLDVDWDESLVKTPHRVAKMYVNEIFSGLDEGNEPRIMTVNNGDWETVKYSQMILEKDIPFYSVCEHHFVPIVWVAHIAYIPWKKIIWLSKLNRVLEHFARRPQVQERLTEQVFERLSKILGTDDVAVIIDASHMCVSMRWVKHHWATTLTNRLWWKFLEGELRSELFSSIKK